MPSPKNFLIITQVFSPDPAAVGQYFDEAAQAIAGTGAEVTVLTANRGYDNPDECFAAHEDRDGIRIRRLPLSSFGKASIPVRIFAQLSFLVQCILRGLFTPKLTDLLVSTSPPMAAITAVIIGLFRPKLKVHYWVMDINPDQAVVLGAFGARHPLVLALDWLNRRILQRADSVIALDRFMAERLLAKLTQKAGGSSQKPDEGRQRDTGTQQVYPERAKVEESRRQRGERGTNNSALSPQVSPLSPQASPLSPQASPLSPQVSALSPQASPLSPQASALSPQASPLSPQVSPLSPQVSALSPQVSALTILPPWPMDDYLETVPHADNPFRKAQGWGDKFVVMYSGNHSLVHPLDTILDAAEALKEDPRFVFVFIGGGKGKQAIEERILKPEDRDLKPEEKAHCLNAQHSPLNPQPSALSSQPSIVSLPYQPLDQIRYSLSAADLHIVSLGDNMSGIVHPCKIYGALSIGRPVLALGPKESYLNDIVETESGERREETRETSGIGWAIEHGDVAAAVAALKEAAGQTQQERAGIGRRAKQIATEKFGRSTLVAKFLDTVLR
jgi:glycosyltransferase involved in cell wall biosynthesis